VTISTVVQIQPRKAIGINKNELLSGFQPIQEFRQIQNASTSIHFNLDLFSRPTD
jgi:hypothetical protein